MSVNEGSSYHQSLVAALLCIVSVLGIERLAVLGSIWVFLVVLYDMKTITRIHRRTDFHLLYVWVMEDINLARHFVLEVVRFV